MAGILFVRSSKPSDTLILQAHTDSAVEDADDMGYPYTDINSNVLWANVGPYMTSFDWELFFYSGHGDYSGMYGDSLDALISNTTHLERLAYFNGKAVYSMACQTGQSLLGTLVNNGAVAVAGFASLLRIWSGGGGLSDPYAVSTLAGPVKFLESVVEGKTWGEAREDANEEWDEQYAYWTSGAGSGLAGAIECAVRILEQKTNFVISGPQSDSFSLSSPSVQTGSIYVSTNRSDATFTITGPGGTYSGSGSVWSQSGIPVGSYTITYGNIAGFTKPPSETKSVTANSTTSFTGTYAAASTTGSIYVTTNLNLANFSITGPASYSGSGQSWSKLNAPTGTYTITYAAVSGYTTPSPQTFTLSAGGTISFSGTYALTPATGSINVTTNLSTGSFAITGPASYSGYGTSWNKTGAPAGTYTITFGSVSGYTTPSSYSLTLSAGGSISFSGNYVQTPLTGTINVSTNLTAATFTLAGPVTYTGSGTSWSNNAVPIGAYTITYGAVAGYATPNSQTITVGLGGSITFVGTYVATATTGTIYVTTNLTAGNFTISGAASYSGSGKSWRETSAPAGSYTIAYGAVAGYATPSGETLVLTAGSSIRFTGEYIATPATTRINVETNLDLASFNISGPASYSGSGKSWSTTGAPTGIYTVTFGTVPGYTTPPSQMINLGVSGTIYFSGYYVSTTGTIQVSCNIGDASFSITGAGSYSGSGTTLTQTGALPGTYTITYGAVSGYTTPSSQTLTLSAGDTIYFTGTYVKTTGTISVSTNLASAAFDIYGPSNYSGSGTTWSIATAPPGAYTIAFRDVTGYSKPASQSYTLSAGGSINFTGTYTGARGTISVTTNLASATFSITGPASYSSSGLSYSVANAPPGTYTITFGAVSKYTTPSAQTITLSPGGIISFTGVYEYNFGTIQVGSNLAGASFSINGPENFTGSGLFWITYEATAGSYTIYFNPIAGYNTPVSQTKLLSPGGGIEFSGLYTLVDPDPDTPIVTESKGILSVQEEVRVAHGVKNVSSIASHLFASVNSSINTEFTTTSVKDYSAWDLSTVSEGQAVVTTDGYSGLIKSVDDTANTIHVFEWVRFAQYGMGMALGVPANGQKVSVFKITHAKRVVIRASDENSNYVYVGFSSSVSSSTGMPLSYGTGTPNKDLEIISDKPINLTKVYVVSASAQKVDWDVGLR